MGYDPRFWVLCYSAPTNLESHPGWVLPSAIARSVTPEGLERARKANWRHGHYSVQAQLEQSLMRQLLRNGAALMKQMGESRVPPRLV